MSRKKNWIYIGLESVFIVLVGLTSFLNSPKIKNQTQEISASKKAGHELSEANVKGVMWFGIALTIGAVTMHIGLAALFFGLRRHDERQSIRDSGLNTDLSILAQRSPPPEPRLQNNPQKDLKEYFEKEEELLSSYGWIDVQAEKVRIPINRAIDLITERSKEKNHEK